MGTVVRLDDFRRSPWREALSIKNESSTIQVYVNDETGEVELAQMNDEGEAIRTVLHPLEASLLHAVLTTLKRRQV